MTLNDLQRAELVLFAAREVGPKGSLEQMKAVCYCIRNRVRAGWHDGRWITVMEKAHEEAAHYTEKSAIDIDSRNLQRLMHDVDDIYYSQNTSGDGDGFGSDGLEHSVGTQKFWMFLDRPATDWFITNVVRDMENHPSHAQMGLMMFFE